MTGHLVTGEDELPRCWWGADPEIYRSYHDSEWGRPVTDDTRLFEKLCLEGFQAGLSWLTILRKREDFRDAFSGFEPRRVARFDENDVQRLLSNPGIVRHEGKIRSAINNANRALELITVHGSLSAYFWGWADRDETPPTEIPSTSQASTSLSKELKALGWSFVGPTTAYAFMQAMGLVNDHLDGCHAREVCERERRDVIAHTL